MEAERAISLMPFSSFCWVRNLLRFDRRTVNISSMKGTWISRHGLHSIQINLTLLCLEHSRAGSSVMAAYVEIIFDNSDGKIQTVTSFSKLFLTFRTSSMNKPLNQLFEIELCNYANVRLD
jgi:hypothetical protein